MGNGTNASDAAASVGVCDSDTVNAPKGNKSAPAPSVGTDAERATCAANDCELSHTLRVHPTPDTSSFNARHAPPAL